MKQLKLCMMTTFYPPYHFGGDAVFVHRLVQALAERGHLVDVIHSEDAYRLRARDPKPEFEEHANVTRYGLRSRFPKLNALCAHQVGAPAGYRPRIQALLDEREYDVIHYHNVSLLGGPGLLRLGDAIKLYTTHEYWLVCPTHVLFKYDREACTERACLRCTLHSHRPPQLWRLGSTLADCATHVNRFLMPSRFARDRHRADGLDGPMTVLPNFVPKPTEAHDETPVSKRPFFLCVGRLEKLKGVQDLIEVFRGYRAADLVIAGDGDYRKTLEHAASGLDHVRFLGGLHPDELGRYYRQAVAVLVPSLCYEVFPLTPIEAFMHETPVIARRIGALTEIIEESGGGMTFQTLDECTRAMDQLQNDPELRNELGARGACKANERWTPEAHLARYFEIIAELMAK